MASTEQDAAGQGRFVTDAGEKAAGVLYADGPLTAEQATWLKRLWLVQQHPIRRLAVRVAMRLVRWATPPDRRPT